MKGYAGGAPVEAIAPPMTEQSQRSDEASRAPAKAAPEGTTAAQDASLDLFQRALPSAASKGATTTANAAERANISRFFQDPGPGAAAKELADALKRLRESAAGDEYRSGSLSRGDPARKDISTKDQSDDPRALFAPATNDQTEPGRPRDKRATGDANDPAQSDDENKHGLGWIREAPDPDEAAKRRGIREIDVLADRSRCQGILEDGSRCLRKAQEGTHYCRAHASTSPAMMRASDNGCGLSRPLRLIRR
jgi:hypothetical protein